MSTSVRSHRWIAIVLFLCVCYHGRNAFGQAGTWTPLTNPAPVFGNALLLTDGSVMVQQLQGNAWYRLKPDASGSYVNGTWSQLASMHDTRLYFGSVVLKDGRVLVAGGEYGSGKSSVEIYDPVLNTWSYVNSWPAGSPGSTLIDSTCTVLPDGRMLLLPWYGAYWIYDPATDGWKFGNSSKSSNDEQSVAQLPDGSFFVPWDANSQRYVPSLDQWVASATPPNSLIDSTSEIGPACLLYDGRVFCLGATGNTDFYTPPGTPTGLGTWTAGPIIPNGKKSDDAPAAVMPNGNVLIAADAGGQSGPTTLFEYDTVANSYTTVGSSANAGNVIRMLLLPSGQVLVCFGDSMQIYTPVGSPNAAWQPTISNVAQNSDGSYTVTGTKLNGLTEGAYFGDDAQMSTNYPIVRLVNGSNTYYAKSYNFSTMGVATGSATVTADFIISGIPNGNYSLYVVASGVASNPVPFSFVDSSKPIITSLRTAAGTKNAAFSYSIKATGSPTSYNATGLPTGLTVNAGTGVISGTPTITGTFNVTISATNAAGTGSATLAISINAAPVITVAAAANPTTAETGQPITFTITASDPDGDPLVYSWANGTGGHTIFGYSSATQTFSYASIGTYTVTVTVADGHGHSVNSSVNVTITAGPSITTVSPLPVGDVGAAFSQTFAASGGTAPYTWSVPFTAPPAGLTLSSAGVLSGTPTATGTTNFTVRLTDAVGAVVNKSFALTINSAPSITTASLPNGTSGVAYSQTLAGSGGTTPYTWTVSAGALPAGLTLSSSGVLSGTPTTGATSNFTIKLTDSAAGSATQSYSVTISGGVSITTASLPAGDVSAAYSQTFAASGGTSPYTWTISSGTLPAGLTLSSTGVLSGTPTTAGASTFTILVTDNIGGTASHNFTLTINAVLAITTTSPLPAGDVSSVYSQTFTVSGGTSPFTWSVSAGPLPAGLTLNSAGVLSGTPTTAGTSNFTVKVADAAGGTTTKAFALTINATLAITTTSPLKSGDVGTAYSISFAATGGTSPITWSVSAGTLPAGLTLNAAGVLSGTPTTAGTSNFTVKVADAIGASATKAFALTINAAPSITTTSLPNGVVGTGYSQTLAVSSGTSPFAWSISSGALPAGLTLSSAGVLSGTPTTAGVSNFTVKVSDAVGVASTQVLSLTISNVATPPVITSVLTATGTVGALFSYTITASNNPTSYNATGLPAGLSVNTSTGVISGTPTTAGTSSVTLSATNASGTGTATLNFTINAANQPPVITSAATATPNPAIIGQSVTLTVSASDPDGNALTYAWTFGDGANGNGSSIAHAFAAAGTYTATATVTDGKGGSVTSSVSVVVSTSLNSGLVAYWKLDDGSGTSALDSSGNGNTGTLVNGPIWGTGKVGGSLQFDGVNDHVDANVNNNVGTGDFTWTTWTYPRRLTNLWEGLMANGEYSPALYSKLYTAGQWGIYWGGDKPSGNTLTTGRWYHLAVIRQGGVIKFYQDGVQTSQTYAVSTSMAKGVMHLGTSGVAAGARYGQADLDDVRFYNRALNASEIAALANPIPGAQTTGTDTGASLSMTVSKIQGAAKFATGGHDVAVVAGLIPNLPAGFDPSGQQLVLNIGGANVSFTLNSKGQGKSPQGAIALRLKPAKHNSKTNKLDFQGGNVAFVAKIVNGTWSAVWGLDPNVTSKSSPMSMVVTLQVAGQVYVATVTATYTSKAHVGAAFKKK